MNQQPAGPFDGLSAKVLEWAVVALLTWLVTRLIEWRRKLHLITSDWELLYLHNKTGSHVWKERPPDDWDDKPGPYKKVKFSFTMRAFNTKSKPSGLHKMSVDFTNGPWFKRQLVSRADKLLHGPLYTVNSQQRRDPFGEMALPSHEWAVEEVGSYLDRDPRRDGADTAWFVGHLPDGRQLRWKLARLDAEVGDRAA